MNHPDYCQPDDAPRPETPPIYAINADEVGCPACRGTLLVTEALGLHIVGEASPTEVHWILVDGVDAVSPILSTTGPRDDPHPALLHLLRRVGLHVNR